MRASRPSAGTACRPPRRPWTCTTGRTSSSSTEAPNRPAALGTDLTGLLDFVARRFPGSWGLLYERSDDLERPPGPGAFRVRVMARGRLVTRLDPFLSPVNPVIED
ncbi:immunity 7 family protein [Amycolatopsis sp. NBC_00355]|uniref:Imm7 family immunity protein n=1 Tax=Amycolatopsis sp. NBC_00355 TaxID=2975957 RepID=UPI002E252ABD